MKRFYPSYQALMLAEQVLDAVGARAPGYQGRIGVNWYWQLSGGVLVAFGLDYTVTEQRWDVLLAEASSPRVGVFSAVRFPFAIYGTLITSPPYIHDLDGEAEWSNRLYFQMGHLIEDATRWLTTLQATVIDPSIRPPAAFPQLNTLEREIVIYALEQLNGRFQLQALRAAFEGRITRAELSRLARRWEEAQLLTETPRRVTVALRALAEAYTP